MNNERIELEALKRTLDRYLPGFSRRYAEIYTELRKANDSEQTDSKGEAKPGEAKNTRLSTLEVEEHAIGAGE